MPAAAVLAQTRLARHLVMVGQVAAVMVGQRQAQTGHPIRAAAAVARKQLLAGLVVMAL
jgi:hypothetical protein